ncbi:hypothetical protein MMC07_008396 [Pseudocyphellaria aurata]|nr:hypothetical protein [Pseudocyphellaria aurata]
MTKPGKPKSKRTPVRLRHKIEKASAAKQRKQRKLAKSNPEWRSRLKKDPGIPNLFPYKDRLLHDIEEKKRLKEEEFVRKREEAKGQNTAVTVETDAADSEDVDIEDEEMEDEAGDVSANPMGALLASARARAAEYENALDVENDEMDEDASEGGVDINSDDFATSTRSQSHESSRRAYDKVFKNVLSCADIILYVLDARDPDGTRSREIERQIMAADAGSKRLILVVNKIDLVPPAVLKAWLVHLRRSFPTLPLRASHPAPNARTFDHKALTQKATSETLLRALKTYANAQQLKRSISVGVIGYPNVGKSSVINSLTARLGGSSSSRSACPTGAEAGITTSLREVKLDNKLKLLDSPGIVFPSCSSDSAVDGQAPTQAHLALLSALPPKQITDPIPAVSLLLQRPAIMPSLLKSYGIPALVSEPANGDQTTDFLVQVARKRGRLSKGGVPNLISAAMSVLSDWRDGRIQGWVDAPSGQPQDVADEKKVVSEWAGEFKLEGLWGDDERIEGEDEGMDDGNG